MEIQGPGGISGPNRMEPHRTTVRGSDQTGEPANVNDSVQISEQARMLEMLSQVPAVRMERIQELKALIQAGEYETPEKLAVAVTKLMEEL